jgi:predicted ATPase
MEDPVSIDAGWNLLDPISKINWMMREDLFLDNAYQLNGEVLCLTDLDEIIDSWVEAPRHYAKIVRLFLTDNHQRKVEIEDVGSGIGYILPVLASLAHDGRALIQQPELHLHPALQSALGESIIRTIENYQYHDQFCLIETHSEHILLRILKLLKKSTKRKDEVLSPLTFEKVSILYFEPMPDGSTKIQRLRLTPDGKLIDRWPGGFFNERYKDLFDDE